MLRRSLLVKLEWAVGVTTVPQRICLLLPQTLESLRRGGFGSPRLFVDGCDDPAKYRHFKLPCTFRYPKILAWGNWWLAINELYLRQPFADRYCIFQDDIVCVRNLRQYLEATEFPAGGYQNLIVYPSNFEPDRRGWYKAPSRGGTRGLGAQGLVFDRTAMMTLIGREFMPLTEKPCNREQPERRTKFVDGAVVSKLESFGIMEHVHGPSLIAHIGEVSAIGNSRQPPTVGFPGQDFDGLSLLNVSSVASARNGPQKPSPLQCRIRS